MPCCPAASRSEFLGLFLIGGQGRDHLSTQRPEIGSGGFHTGQLTLQRAVPGCELARFHAMLARLLFNRGQTPLNGLLARGVELQRFKIVRQCVRRVLNAGNRFVEWRVQSCETGVECAGGTQRRGCARQQLVRVALLGFIQTLKRSARRLRQFAAMGDAQPFLVEREHFAR